MKRRVIFAAGCFLLVLAGLLFLVNRTTRKAETASASNTAPIARSHSAETLPPSTDAQALATTSASPQEAAVAATTAPIPAFPTPSQTERPYIRVQINLDGSLEGIFATRCEPVKQDRFLEAKDGYYYRLVSPTTGETLIDGTIAKPVIRHQHRGVDEHGVAYVVCPTEPLKQPVFFDIPNVAARLEVYQTTPQSPLAAMGLPLVKAVNLTPQ